MDVREKLVELLEPHMSGLACEYESGSCELTSCRSCNARNIADHLIANGVTVQEWVSVKDGLPERPPDRVDEQGRSWFTPNIDCIVYDGKSVFAANYCFQNKCFWYADTLHPLKNITHWMPMPDPPKGE